MKESKQHTKTILGGIKIPIRHSFFWILVAYAVSFAVAGIYLFTTNDFSIKNSFIADFIATVLIFFFSFCFKNSSFYDPYWSVAPPFFLTVWFFGLREPVLSLRVVLLASVVWFWAIRLTANWAMNWKGLQHEDWRYPIVRGKNRVLGVFRDFAGVHFFPTVQVFLGMLPIYAVVVLSEQKSLSYIDWIAFLVGVSAVLIQLVSDHQMRMFLEQSQPGQSMDRGLWLWSRHPNYFGEISFWFSLALFGYAAHPQLWWWMFPGAFAMLAMFLGISIPFMEKRSLQRRPGYQQVIDRVSMLIPFPPKKQPVTVEKQ